MRNGLYFFWGDGINDGSIGENRKVLGQIRAFNEAGVQFQLYSFPVEVETVKTKILSRLPFTNCIPVWHYDECFETVDYIYFRRPPFMNIYMYETLKKLKEVNPKIIIMMEIPTFPYDKEMIYRVDRSLINYPLLWKDIFWRDKIHKILDYIVMPGDDLTELWQCPVLHISNGIFLDDYELRSPVEDDTIDLLAIANFKEWHGYERIIHSLKNYNGNRKIKIHFVGDGTEVPEYKKMVTELSLENNVVFYGRKSIDELADLYNIADIGLCSFGAYKKELYLSKELKSREYLAKGLPIISGCELDVLKKGDEGYFLFPNDSSEINMEDIVNFYDDVYNGNNKIVVAKKMRSIAENNFDMKKCMQSVIEIMTS